MSTIGGLLLPHFQPYDLGRTLAQATNIQGGQLSNQTRLLELADLRRAQEEAAAARSFLQQHPELVIQGGMPTSTLGSLQPAPPGGPLLQQQVLPGQPFAPPQVVPGGQDLSRFAAQGAPTSTLASLGPQPQPQAPPHPQQRLLELARTHPGAALAVQQQMQQAQDTALRREEQRLSTGTKVLEYVGRVAQGVTDQASLDAMRQDLRRLQLHQYAAQLPQVYTKEAMAPFIATANSVLENQTLGLKEVQAGIEARQAGRSTDVDNQLRAMGVPPGQETPAQMKEALQAVQEGKIAVSASHGTGQLVQTPTGIVRVNPRTGTVDPVEAPGGGPLYPKPTEAEQRAQSFGDRAKAAHDNAVALEAKGLTPSLWSKVGEALPFGLGNYLVGEDQQRYRQAVSQFAQALLRKESGAAISQSEYDMTETTYFPQPGNSPQVIAEKRRERERVIQSMQEEGKQTGRTGTQATPTSQGAGGGEQGARRPVGEMSREELLAERERLRKGGR